MAELDSDAAKMRTMALFEVTEFEEKVVEPYLKLGNESLEQKLARVKEQTQVILQTNVVLQEKLTEEDLICKELEDRHDELEAHEEVLHSERVELKELEEEVKEQLQTISQGRRSEKIRLQTAQLQMEEQVSSLQAERSKLLNQDRAARDTIERQAKMIESLQGEVISLEEKKAWLERSADVEDGVGTTADGAPGVEMMKEEAVASAMSLGAKLVWGTSARQAKAPEEGSGARRKYIAGQKGNKEALPLVATASNAGRASPGGRGLGRGR